MNSILKFVLAISPLIPSILCFVVIHSNDGRGTFIYVFFSSVVISILGYAATSSFIPTIGEFTLKKGICGKDLGKKVRSVIIHALLFNNISYEYNNSILSLRVKLRKVRIFQKRLV